MGSITEDHASHLSGPNGDAHASVPPNLEDLPDLYGWPRENERGYRIREMPSESYRPLRVVVLGCGASGISFAKFAQDDLKNVDFVLYEKNSDVGGTWLENRYPGCACDVPSVTYQFTWEPDTWSHFYSESPEIHRYFRRVAAKYNVLKYTKLNHTVTNALWDQESGKWEITVRDEVTKLTFVDECDVFINAGGPLNHWNMPKIDGIGRFKGVLAHTANYPEGLDLKGKRVAVCGIGSSGIQVIASIQKEVSKLYTWIRTPTWVLGSFGAKYMREPDTNSAYTEEELRLMRQDPTTYLKYRKNIELSISEGFGVFFKNTPEANAAREIATKEMRSKLACRPTIADALIPKDFPVGCKRPTPGIGFLEALCAENVVTYPGGQLTTITEKGFLNPDGQEEEVDVIILATGFNTTWIPRFSIIANGKNLQDMYKENPLSYLGIAAPEMPNYFTYYGPYGPLGQASAVVMIEFFTRYFNAAVRKIQAEWIKSLAPRMDVAKEFQEHADLYLKRTVWDSNCRSWWKGGKVDGKIMLYPGSRTQYMELISSPRYEDYDIKYHDMNRWAFLGNGWSTRDYDGRDITWFWGMVNGKDKKEEYELNWKASAEDSASHHQPDDQKVKDLLISPSTL
ncbi:uncharacterized protein A1O5_07307 [Cladophialophora psammophila CBS 110553]|uniref:Cyclohexanone monooxygenase n=1 Tax=Cladophialophora psammophila CBS 110553 TaxID=1182543 RepID=W9WX83_9EURO|nr:uncharacterized protein A1O5_07307 [Cladophialophora psammophila CBS 110553]EXJ69271.1 hypothetical protein A1O5_07307 [Cladophialophora psammophila CBS 110553]